MNIESFSHKLAATEKLCILLLQRYDVYNIKASDGAAGEININHTCVLSAHRTLNCYCYRQDGSTSR